MLIYYEILILILSMFVFTEVTPRITYIYVSGIMVILICLAGFRGYGTSRDMLLYQLVFDSVQSFSDYKNIVAMEPMATWIPVILKYLGIYSVGMVFLCFAILGVGLKYYGILEYAEYPILSILLYYSNLFFKLDFTQVRAGVAVGFAFLAVKNIYHCELRKFLFKIIFGAFFHVSILIMLPLYFLNSQSINRFKYTFLIIISFIISVLKINFLLLIPGLSSINGRIEKYNALASFGVMGETNILSIGNILNALLIIFMIYKYKKIFPNNQYSIIFLKITALGLAAYGFFGPFSYVLAGRLYDFLNFFGIISFTYLIYIWEYKFVGKSLVLIYALYFVIKTLNSDLIYPYYSWIYGG